MRVSNFLSLAPRLLHFTFSFPLISSATRLCSTGPPRATSGLLEAPRDTSRDGANACFTCTTSVAVSSCMSAPPSTQAVEHHRESSMYHPRTLLRLRFSLLSFYSRVLSFSLSFSLFFSLSLFLSRVAVSALVSRVACCDSFSLTVYQPPS